MTVVRKIMIRKIKLITTCLLLCIAGNTQATLVAEWQLDETTWDGTAGEILDNTGHGLNGVAVSVSGNFPQPDTDNPPQAGNPGTCGYGIFDGPNRGYIRIDDPGNNSILDINNNLTVTAWVYPHSYPRSGLMTIASKDENWEFHLRSNGRINWWFSHGNFDSNSSVPLNRWTHIALVYQRNRHTIYINGVADSSANTNRHLTTQNDPVYIGTDLGFDSRTFDGLIDEVRIYNNQLPQTQVQRVMNDTHPCASSAGPDHYHIQASNGVSCEPINVTITAHDASHNAVDAQGRTLSLTTSTNKGTFTPTAPQFASGASELTTRLRYSDLGGNNSEIFNIDVSDGSISEHSSEDPEITMSLSGLRFLNQTDNTTIIPTQVAGIPSPQQLFVQAIRAKSDDSDPSAPACVGLYPSTAVTLRMAGECKNPASCRLSKVLINNTNVDISSDNNGPSASSFTDINLTFDADSKAPISINYTDVGQIQLHVEDQAERLTGSSNDFVVRPHHFEISSVPGNAGTTNSGNGFMASAQPFTAIVQARNAGDAITPNYGQESTPASVTVSLDSLVFPVGGSLGALSNPSNFALTTNAGEFSNNTLEWNEVGTFTLVADVAGGDYLGTGLGALTFSTSGDIGRFYPANFSVSGSNLDTWCEATNVTTGSFSYLSQPNLRLTYTLTARNSSDNTVINYDNTSLSYLITDSGTPIGSINYHAENADNGSDLNSRITVSPSPAVSWDNGVYELTDVPGQLNRIAVLDGPFSDTQFSLDVTDPDGATLDVANLNQNPDTTGDCLSPSNCTSAAIGNPQVFRFGRAIIENASGPESAPLPVIFGTEYWNGTNFMTANDDLCSTLAFTEISYAANNPITNPQAVSVGIGTSNGQLNAVGSAAAIISGSFGLSFSAPNNTGQFPVSVDLTNYPWLRFDWDQNNDYNNDTALPDATINFGAYRGHDRVIYWRERF